MTVSFPEQPKIQPTRRANARQFAEDRDSHLPVWTLVAPLVVVQDSRTFVIPEGFQTDLASIPWFGWFVQTPASPTILAQAVSHDYIWRNAGVLPGHTWTFEESNRLLYDGCRSLGMSYWRRTLIDLAVSWFGKKTWNNYVYGQNKGFPA